MKVKYERLNRKILNEVQMEEFIHDERCHRAGVYTQNTKQINGQITLAEVANKTHLNHIIGF